MKDHNDKILEFTPFWGYDFETASWASNRVSGQEFGYVTAEPVTQEMVDNNKLRGTDFKLGEWYRTNKYDPRIVAKRKLEASNGQ